jgi:hypothetical protein
MYRGSSKLKIEPLWDPAIPLSDINTKEYKSIHNKDAFNNPCLLQYYPQKPSYGISFVLKIQW